MRVALVSSGSGSRGGGEIYLTFLAEGLSALGHEVQALVPDHGRMDELAGRLAHVAKVQRFPFRATYDRRLRPLGAWLDRGQQQALTARFARLAPDILHVNQQVAEDGLDLVRAAAASGVPWLSTIHVGRSAQALGARLGGLRDRVTTNVLCGARGDHIAVCAAAREQLAERLGSGPRLHVVHNGVPKPTDLAAARAEARADWGAGDGEVVVGTVGRIEEQKDPVAFVGHIAPVAAEAPVRAVWIGDGSLRRVLETCAGVSGPLPLVVDGWRRDASRRLAGLDVFVLPSRFEGLPLALLEAMHAGLPVVASPTDGVAEAIRDGETGFLCATPGEWQAALGRLARDADLRKRMGAAAQAEAAARFSTDAMARATAQLYTETRARAGAHTMPESA